VKRTMAMLTVFCLAGCHTYQPPVPPAEHPAYPQAHPGFVEPLSPVLRIEHDELPSPPPELQRQGMDDMGSDAEATSEERHGYDPM
jgi:hypothetical protein